MFSIRMAKKSEIAIHDMADLLRTYPSYAHRATASALKSTGYNLRQEMKDSIPQGPDSAPWPHLNPRTGILARAKNQRDGGLAKNYRMVWRGPKGQKKRVRTYKYHRDRKSSKTAPLLRFRGALRYFYQDDKDAGIQRVKIGFVRQSRRLYHLAHMHAEGYRTVVTPRMRKFFFAMGVPLKKSTHVLKTPDRPLVDPIFNARKDEIFDTLRQKYVNNLVRYVTSNQKRQRAA